MNTYMYILISLHRLYATLHSTFLMFFVFANPADASASNEFNPVIFVFRVNVAQYKHRN